MRSRHHPARRILAPLAAVLTASIACPFAAGAATGPTSFPADRTYVLINHVAYDDAGNKYTTPRDLVSVSDDGHAWMTPKVWHHEDGTETVFSRKNPATGMLTHDGHLINTTTSDDGTATWHFTVDGVPTNMCGLGGAAGDDAFSPSNYWDTSNYIGYCGDHQHPVLVHDGTFFPLAAGMGALGNRGVSVVFEWTANEPGASIVGLDTGISTPILEGHYFVGVSSGASDDGSTTFVMSSHGGAAAVVSPTMWQRTADGMYEQWDSPAIAVIRAHQATATGQSAMFTRDGKLMLVWTTRLSKRPPVYAWHVSVVDPVTGAEKVILA